MDIYDFIMGIGVFGIVLVFIFLICFPLICAVIVGTWAAGILGLSGAVWWAFLGLFVLIILLIIGALSSIANRKV